MTLQFLFHRLKQALCVACATGAMLLSPAGPEPARGADQPALSAEVDQLNLFLSADQLVETATRNPKPVSEVAENVTIITAQEIEAMNAHTVAEVLNRVSGLIVDGSYTDFGSRSATFIQGSGYEQVLVLLDGMRWGYVSFDFPETNTIPVQIIKRIEVIKGPASSAWGSSLGGVVNIITKKTGTTTVPTGTLSGSYGENSTSDLRAEAAGSAGPVGYYLYAGRQKSDGIKDTWFFDSQSFYGKLRLPLPGNMEIKGTIGYSQPDNKYYKLPEYDDEGVMKDRAFYSTINFSAPLGDSVTLNLAAHRLEDTFTDNWQMISTGDPYNKLEYRGIATGADALLVWNGESQTMILGAETEHRENTSHDLLAPYTAPTTSEDLWAVFINDTIRMDRLTITPGLRYDHLSVADDILNPSLGLTYRLNSTTLLRGNVGHGFRKPYPSVTEGDSYFNALNPNLKSETVWSYQAGLETTAISFLRLKATLFDHQSDEVWIHDPDTWAYVNNGNLERQGLELEMTTASFHNFSITANGMYLLLKPDQGSDTNQYTANLLLQYDDGAWRAQLFGHYLWVDEGSTLVTEEKKLGTFLWDAVAGKTIMLREGVTSEIFVALHNITNTDQYIQSYFPTAPRWIEAGLRIQF